MGKTKPPSQEAVIPAKRKRSARSTDLIAGCQLFLEQHDAWEAHPARPLPDDDYWDNFDDLVGLFEEGDTPRDCRQLDDLVMEMADMAEAYFNKLAAANPNSPRKPAPYAFFARLQVFREKVEQLASNKPKWPPLESIELLNEQKVSHAQIALIYGFVPKGEEANANRYAHIVAAELKEHGSAVDWSKWRDPREVEAEAHEQPRARRRKQSRQGVYDVKSAFNSGKTLSQVARESGQSEGEIMDQMARMEAAGQPVEV